MTISSSRAAAVLALSIITLVTLATASIGCGASIKYVDFDVKEGNRTVTVKKFYNDGLDGRHSQDPTERAYQAVAHGDIKEGIRLAKEAVEANPRDFWVHYNLGILHEAAHEWDAAKVQMEEAKRIDPKKDDAQREIAFIDAHK